MVHNANLQKRMKGTSTSNPLATTIAVRRPCLSTSANFEKLPSPFKKTSRAKRRYTPTHADEDIYIALTRRTCWRCCCFRWRRIICFFHMRYFLRVLLDNAERLQHNSISTANWYDVPIRKQWVYDMHFETHRQNTSKGSTEWSTHWDGENLR